MARHGVVSDTDVAPSTGETGLALVMLSAGGTATWTPAVATVVRDLTGQRHGDHELTRAQLEHALEQAQLQVASDRERIGRDLRDLVIKRLFATGLALQGLADLVELPAATRQISAAVNELDSAIADIRTIVFALGHHRASLSPGLRGHILEVISDATRGLGHDPALRLAGPVDTAVPDQVGVHLLAVLCEALSNVVRRAHATRTSIVVQVGDGVVLQVTHDGVSMIDGTRTSGPRNMRRLAESLGGTMRMVALPAGGTFLEWQVPIAR